MTYSPFEIIPSAGTSDFVLTCDHAANTVPDFVNGGDLGLPQHDLNRHIAYDVGAAGVTRHLAHLLGAPAVLSNFSRLVIDPNRGPDDPTLVMKLYDGTLIPANRYADDAEVQRRKEALYDPYHAAIDQVMAAQPAPVFCPVHSMTDQLNGRPKREMQIAVLFAQDERLSAPFIEFLRQEPDLTIGSNAPYIGYLPGDSVDRHATAHGHLNILIEVRNDLIETPENQRYWAERLAPIMQRTLRHYYEQDTSHG